MKRDSVSVSNLPQAGLYWMLKSGFESGSRIQFRQQIGTPGPELRPGVRHLFVRLFNQLPQHLPTPIVHFIAVNGGIQSRQFDLPLVSPGLRQGLTGQLLKPVDLLVTPVRPTPFQ